MITEILYRQRHRCRLLCANEHEDNPAATAARPAGFTLAELLVTVGVLVVLVLLFTQLLNSTATITTLGHKQMDADSQARQLLDRMAIDFAQMVKRNDVDFFGKGRLRQTRWEVLMTWKRSDSVL